MRIIILAATLLLSGCGTYTTLSSPDWELASNLKRKESFCNETSRIYSGVSYNFCMLNSDPSTRPDYLLLDFYLHDIVFCAVADTLVLPYTAIQQYENGNLTVNR